MVAQTEAKYVEYRGFTFEVTLRDSILKIYLEVKPLFVYYLVDCEQYRDGKFREIVFDSMINQIKRKASRYPRFISALCKD